MKITELLDAATDGLIEIELEGGERIVLDAEAARSAQTAILEGIQRAKGPVRRSDNTLK